MSSNKEPQETELGWNPSSLHLLVCVSVFSVLSEAFKRRFLSGSFLSFNFHHCHSCFPRFLFGITFQVFLFKWIPVSRLSGLFSTFFGTNFSICFLVFFFCSLQKLHCCTWVSPFFKTPSLTVNFLRTMNQKFSGRLTNGEKQRRIGGLSGRDACFLVFSRRSVL